MISTPSDRHNGCTAANFVLPDHGFLLLTCSTGPMEWSTGNSYQAEALTSKSEVKNHGRVGQNWRLYNHYGSIFVHFRSPR
jgi:hypothetical protein